MALFACLVKSAGCAATSGCLHILGFDTTPLAAVETPEGNFEQTYRTLILSELATFPSCFQLDRIPIETLGAKRISAFVFVVAVSRVPCEYSLLRLTPVAGEQEKTDKYANG